jgi:uncharacterized protein (TIGR02271 family)
MSKNSDKLKSEFEDKLREGHAASPQEERDIQDEYGRDERDNLDERDRLQKRDRLDADIEYAKTIPIIEERARIDKEIRETGQVHIEKEVHREEVSLDLPIIHEEAEVERVEINQYVDTPPPPVRYEGDKMIIPVLKEVLVVEKRILVVEELHITKHRIEEHDKQKIELRREEIHVERKGIDPRDQERR